MLKKLFYRKGFSLIELMVVVCILGLLTSISMTAYSQYVAKTYVTKMFSFFDQLRKLSDEYYYLNKTFPSAADLKINTLGETIFVDPAYFGEASRELYDVVIFGGANGRIDTTSYELKNSTNATYTTVDAFRLVFSRTAGTLPWVCKIRYGDKVYAPQNCKKCWSIDNGDNCS